MNLKYLPILLALAVGNPILLWAQKEVKPPGVGQTPDLASWTIQITRPSTSNPTEDEAPNIVEVRITKSKTIQRRIYVRDDGEKIEAWAVGIYEVMRHPTSNNCVGHTKEGIDWAPGETIDFPELAWFKPQHFAGEDTYDGKPVFVFLASADNLAGHEQDPRWGKTARLLLDAGTKLPVLYYDGSETHTYTFGEPPAAPLSMPAEFRQELNRHRQAMFAPLRYQAIR